VISRGLRPGGPTLAATWSKLPNLEIDSLEAEEELLALLRKSVARLHSEMAVVAPFMARRTLRWIQSLCPTGREEDYFRGARAPLLLLPWWLEQVIRGAPDLEFQQRVVYSTINAYYFVRLMDNVMDGQGTEEVGLLPAGGFFFSEFLYAYQECFPPESAFWKLLRARWAAMAEATVRDATLREPTEDDFTTVAARKGDGAKIPIAAVCHRYERLDLLEPWFAFHDLLARRQQLLNDLVDWSADLTGGVRTWVLAEAERRRGRGESVAGWMIRDGVEWAAGRLEGWMRELRLRAMDLHCPGLTRYLERIDDRSRAELQELRIALRGLGRLCAALEARR
jgi:hypothetical protein